MERRGLVFVVGLKGVVASQTYLRLVFLVVLATKVLPFCQKRKHEAMRRHIGTLDFQFDTFLRRRVVESPGKTLIKKPL